MAGALPLPFQRLLIAGTLLAVLLPLLLVGGGVLLLSLDARKEDLLRQQADLAGSIAGALEQDLVIQVGEMKEIAFQLTRGTLRDQAIDIFLGSYLDNPETAFRAVMVLDKTGKVERALPPDPDFLGNDLSRQPFLAESREKGAPTWSAAQYFQALDRPVVTLAYPLGERTLVGVFDLARVQAVIQHAGAGVTRRVMVVEREGTLIAHPQRSRVRERSNIREIPLIREGLAGKHGSSIFREGDEEFIGSTARVEPVGWLVVVYEEVGSAFAPIRDLGYVLALGFLLLLLLMMGTSYLMVGRVARPLAELNRTTQRMAQGEFSLLPHEHRDPFTPREIQQLSGSFNAMVETVRSREEGLRSKQAEMDRFFRLTLDLLAIGDTSGRLKRVNPAWEKALGYSIEELEKGQFLQLVHPHDREATLHILDALDRGQEVVDFHNRLRHRDGSWRWIEWRAAPGEGGLFYAAARDVTERRVADEELEGYRHQLEALVRERTRDLENAQRELVRKEHLAALGELTAVVSHELRNPLGTVRNSIFSIGDSLERKEPERTAKALVLAERNIRRCDSIIDELLDFARRRELKRVPTPLDLWVRETMDELPPPPWVTLDLDLHSGGEVLLDREAMRRVLINLMTNAAQAMESDPHPEKRITIRSSVQDGGCVLSVADTGPGIPSEILPRVFEPLFSTKGVGVGLGLPIVKSIVEEHGGTIEILGGGGGRGTTFVIHFPCREKGGPSLPTRPSPRSK